MPFWFLQHYCFISQSFLVLSILPDQFNVSSSNNNCKYSINIYDGVCFIPYKEMRGIYNLAVNLTTKKIFNKLIRYAWYSKGQNRERKNKPVFRHLRKECLSWTLTSKLLEHVQVIRAFRSGEKLTWSFQK